MQSLMKVSPVSYICTVKENLGAAGVISFYFYLHSTFIQM